MKRLIFGLAVAALIGVGEADAALIDRGAGLIYDTDRDITWLQDGNYAFTSGYSTGDGGKMTWHDAGPWAAGVLPKN